MARAKTTSAPQSPGGLDKTPATGMQDAATLSDGGVGELWAEDAVHRGRLRVRTLVTLRWLVLGGEAVLLLGVMALGFRMPYAPCFAIVAAGAWVNLLTGLASPGQRVFGDVEAAAQLAIDIAQVSALVALTGGASNPFVLMLIAPVTLAAATLPRRPVLALGALAILSSGTRAFVSLPLPAAPGADVVCQRPQRRGAAIPN